MTFNPIEHPICFEKPSYISGYSAWVEHIPFAFAVASMLRPKVFVELGTHYGDSYCAFCQAVDELKLPTACFAVDTWQGDEHSKKYGSEVLQTLRQHHDAKYGGFSNLIQSTFDDAASHFQDGDIDLLHIDGLHTYKAVKHDFETWLPKLSARGIILLHDTNVRERGFGVWRLWNELKDKYPNHEFLHGHGLGILAVGDKIPAPLKRLLAAEGEAKQSISRLFSQLGARVSQDAWRDTQISERDSQIAKLGQTVVERDGRIAGLERTLVERDGQIAALNAGVAERDGRIAGLEQMVAERDGQITTLNENVVERDGRIAGLEQAVVERDGQITTLNENVVERDGRIAGLEQAVVERDGQITTLDGNVVERDGRIAGLEQTVAKLGGQIVALNEVVAERDRQITALNANVSERDGQVTTLHEVVAERDGQIGVLEQTMAERDSQNAELNRQHSMLNTELLRLNAERATFGAKIGRQITKLRGSIAPLGTRRGVAVSLIGKFATALFASGLGTAAAKTRRYLSFRRQTKLARKRAAKEAAQAKRNIDRNNGTQASVARPQTDHPQLASWIEMNEPTLDQLSAQRDEAAAFGYKPLVSVIVPIYKVPQDILDETLASLERQTYPNWQACIVWADTDDNAGWEWLQTRTAKDPRFTIKLLDENGGISRNSNAAFELVEGEYIALLDHDDTLTPWAFFKIVKRLQESPELDFIYSDKDSINADGQIRLNALFKPEWSPEMLHSVNYLTHLNVMRTSVVREIGGWRPETDGAQDWDLFFRICERTKNIARIPSILYHWRIIPTSTATGLAAKPYAALGQLKSQQDYFMRRGLAAAVVPSPEGMFKVCWPVHEATTDIIVFQSGSLHQLVNVLDVLRAGKQEAIRHIHVVHSTPANEALNAFQGVWPDRITFTQMETVNWRTAMEAVLSGSVAETILLLEGSAAGLSETLVEELGGWVAQHPDIAWTSAIAINSDNTVYEAGRVIGDDHQSAPMFSGSPLFSFGWFGGPLWYRNARACSPYAVAMKSRDARDALSKADACDGDRDGFVALCLALAANDRRGLIDPFARVYFGKSPEESWPNEGSLYHSDPYFNPAFSQVSPLRIQP